MERGARGRGRSRGRGSRGARGRGRGRGKKIPTRVVSSEEEISQDPEDSLIDDIQTVVLPIQQTDSSSISSVPVADPLQLTEEDSLNNKENENIESSNIGEPSVILSSQPQTIDMEADISQLEAPTFTTITRRGPPEPMLRLKWDHKVSLIGEKVLNPMIHCCDQCDKPILVYGRMIPCKHVFCLKCARAEPIKTCPRCKDKVQRVEQSGLGTVFMCIHGGSRYGNTGCRRTYLSQRDLQAHINHRHVTQAPLSGSDSSVSKTAALVDTKNIQPRKLSESNNSIIPTPTTRIQQQSLQQIQQPRSSQTTVIPSNISVQHQMMASISGRNISNSNLGNSGIGINNQLQDAQQALGKVTIQQQSVAVPPPTILNQHVHHGPPPPQTPAEAMAAYYSTSLQSYVNAAAGTYSAPQVQPMITQNYGTIPSITQQNAAMMTIQMQSGPPPPPPPQQQQIPPPGAFYSFGQQFGHQMPPPPQQHYPFDPTINQQQQQWNQQQYYR